MAREQIRRGLTALAFVTILMPESAAAQGGLLGRVKRRVEDNVGRQAERMVDCAMGDETCVNKARAEGKAVRIDSTKTADSGGGVVGSSGGGGTGGSSAVWANYDFMPGTKTFFYEDFKNDVIGNFPRRYEFINGNIELVTYRERTWLRFASKGKMYIPLPAALPQRYTIETEFWGEPGQECWVYPGGDIASESYFLFGSDAVGGVVTPNGRAGNDRRDEQATLAHTFRVMVDGSYAKIYVNELRVANVPNFNEPRGTRLGFFCDAAIAVGPVRISEGGRKLYDALTADGRVATQGIYFNTGSDQIRPESGPTLREIAAMLTEHDGLRLGIEGHTDNVGAAPVNLDLSMRRAAAVKAYLVGTLKADAARLEASGFGSAKPSQPNTTAEGRQTNRRVELVKLP